jgi:hypothetical protein
MSTEIKIFSFEDEGKEARAKDPRTRNQRIKVSAVVFFMGPPFFRENDCISFGVDAQTAGSAAFPASPAAA